MDAGRKAVSDQHPFAFCCSMVLTVEETSSGAWAVVFSLPIEELRNGTPFSVYSGARQQQALWCPFLSRNEEVLESDPQKFLL